MKKHYYLLIVTCVALLQIWGSAFAQTAPPPLRNVVIQARVTLDDEGRYNYFYMVTNPPGNTLGISEVAVDITTPPDGEEILYLGSQLPGYRKPAPDQLQIAKREGIRVIPFYVLSVPGWDVYGLRFEHDIGVTLVNADASARWARWRESISPILPGNTLGEFQLTSYGLPGIRNIVARPSIGVLDLPPDWTDTESDTDEQTEEKWRKQESLGCLVRTIGATAPPAAFIPVQFNQRILGYLSESVTLRWLKDPNLAQQMRTLLMQNDLALREERYADAQPLLLQFLQLVQAGTPAQRTAEAEGLLYYNAQYLYNRIIDYIPDAVEISPFTALHPLNEFHEVQIRVVRGVLPRPNYLLHAMVVSGPHKGLDWWGTSDDQGLWSFRYRGEKVGTDKIVLLCTLAQADDDRYCSIKNSVPVYVTWEGGPDLLMNEFFPPVVQIPFGRATGIPWEESTINIGTVPAPPSKTRYYLSKRQIFDETAIVLGERDVGVLNVNEISQYRADTPVPPSLEPGLYWLFACADADKQIAELDELNNCRTRIGQMFGIVNRMENRPPDCSRAKASPALLWPPNHKYQGVSITGVTDPDKHSFGIVPVSIRQNEPVNGLGDGDTSPDATLIPLQVRAERSGIGGGRIYRIEFTAMDVKGGRCQGAVTVCVPHDQGKGQGCPDSATPYDSTQR